METSITITVPLEQDALNEAAAKLTDMASSMGKDQDATPPAATVATPPAATVATPPAATPPVAPVGVELDTDGIPWDSRIHSGKKTKLAKSQQWKKKRGVDTDYVAQVEAELKAAMAASPAAPVTATPAVTPPPPAAVVTPPPPAAVVVGVTFPELMSKITSAQLTNEVVLAAVNRQGLQSLALLAARPDLIPAVDAELFPVVGVPA